jgi:hypothetical protein
MKYLLLLTLLSCATEITKTPTIFIEPEPVKPVEVKPDNKVYFTTKISYHWLQNAVNCANIVINDPQFLSDISSVKSFDYSKDNGSDVASFIVNSKPIEVKLFTKYLSKVVAVTYPSKPETYLNTKKNPRSLPGMANTLLHEMTHVANESGKYYTHGSNSSSGKDNSIPYYVGNLAEIHAEKLCKDIQ